MDIKLDELRRLQLTEFEILLVIDNICQKNNIPYSLYCGSLLGAIRHKGFIPWDDDLDICMPRLEYNRFIDIWNKEKPHGYILQNKENTPTFTQSFSKVRKDQTAFVTNDWEGGLYHNGIFVDVMPLDRISENYFREKIFEIRCYFYQLLVREYTPSKSNIIIRRFAALILFVMKGRTRKRVRDKLLQKITKNNNKNNLKLVGIECQETIKVHYPSDSFDDLIYVPFEGKELPIFKNWDCVLREYFGDYMQLPPENKRVPEHHPVALSFDKNYVMK